MISLNLISKNKRAKKGKNLFSIILYSVFGLFTLYFVFEVVFVSVNLYLINQKLTKIKNDSSQLSGQILKDNEKLNNFILSKFILTEINKLKRNKFDYKTYLDQIVALTPSGNQVKTVGFETKGYVSVVVESSDDNSFRNLEENLKNVDLKNTNFDSILINSVSRNIDGGYRTDILFSIKINNGRK